MCFELGLVCLRLQLCASVLILVDGFKHTLCVCVCVCVKLACQTAREYIKSGSSFCVACPLGRKFCTEPKAGAIANYDPLISLSLSLALTLCLYLYLSICLVCFCSQVPLVFTQACPPSHTNFAGRLTPVERSLCPESRIQSSPRPKQLYPLLYTVDMDRDREREPVR